MLVFFAGTSRGSKWMTGGSPILQNGKAPEISVVTCPWDKLTGETTTSKSTTVTIDDS